MKKQSLVLQKLPLLLVLLVGVLLASSCNKTMQLARVQPNNYNVDPTEHGHIGALEAQADAMIAPYREQFESKMNEVLGENAQLMEKGKPESLLGNWLTDLLLVKSRELDSKGVDVAIQNYGGIRITEMQAGKITLEKIYELMPFDNMLVVVECPPKEARMLINKMAAVGGWPMSGSMRYKIKNKEAVNITIDGEPYNYERPLRIAMTDYISNGGNDCDFLKELEVNSTDLFVRDAIIEYCKEQKGPMTAKLDKRITQ